jgi:predicted metal-dependent hydrolase
LLDSNAIIPRRLRFYVPKDLPRYWNDNCPIKTHIFNSIAILAPAFERLAISSALPYKDKIQDLQLKEQILGFIGQESAHGSEFIRFNQILKNQGYDIKRLEKGNLKRFKWLSKKLSIKMHLSLTLAAEHLTAIISDLVLRDKQWLQHAYPSVAALWRWHAIEEIEHKAVVFDLYQSVGGGYFARIIGMWLVTSMLGGLLTRNFFHLVYHDKLLFKLSFWRKFFKVCWGHPGFLRKLILPYLRYVIPYFHPWHQDNHDLISTWKQFFYQSKSTDDMARILEQDATI